MRLKLINIALLSVSLSFMASCSSEDTAEELLKAANEANQPEEVEPGFVEAPKCNGTVTVRVINPADSRASNVDGSIDRYTATRCDGAGGDYTLVSFHGRNQEQIGMVQIIRSSTGQVISELNTLDARVNFAQYRRDSQGRETVYVGVDRNGSDGILCGILAVPLSNHRFVGNAEIYTPYKVDGLSINCLKYTGNFATTGTGENVLFVAAGGNNGLGDDGKAGFTKFGISKEDPTKLTIITEKTDYNYRGYWFSYDFLSTCPAAYAYRTLENGELVYKIGMIQNKDARMLLADDDTFLDSFEHPEATIWSRSDTQVDLGRFCVSSFTLDGSNYVLACTGSKEGGVHVYRHVGSDNSLVLVDTWHKACVNTSSILKADDGKNYVFASCAGGVFKLEVIRDPQTREVRLEPVAKRATTVVTESDTPASTNYVQLRGTTVHVAGGYEGYYNLSWDDPSFVPAEPRED